MAKRDELDLASERPTPGALQVGLSPRLVWMGVGFTALVFTFGLVLLLASHDEPVSVAKSNLGPRARVVMTTMSIRGTAAELSRLATRLAPKRVRREAPSVRDPEADPSQVQADASAALPKPPEPAALANDEPAAAAEPPAGAPDLPGVNDPDPADDPPEGVAEADPPSPV